MKYLICMRPHDNVRYQQSQATLAVSELSCLLSKCGLNEVSIQVEQRGGAPFLSFELADETLPPLLFSHSALYFAAVEQESALIPLPFKRTCFVPCHMPNVQKYKGKTNAAFTSLLINLAKCASAIPIEKIETLLDPLCGRGTSLFSALVSGLNAVGVEQDAASVKECVRYAESFFTYERVPYRLSRASRTLPGARSAPETEFTVGDKASPRTLTILKADSRDTCPAVKKRSADILVADLPYGVQHAPQKGSKMSSLEALLTDALPSYKAALKEGGGGALSFNKNTLKRELLCRLVENAGFTVLDEPFIGFEHWVEQAVTRDIVIFRS